MNPYFLVLNLFLLYTGGQLAAQSSPDDIVIAEKTERYEFVKGDKIAPVQVKELFNTRYRCNTLRGQIPYVEFYDEQSRINDAAVWVSGKKLRNLVVQDQYYSIDNIFYSDARVYAFNVPLEKKGSESTVALEKTVLDPKYFTTVYFPESLPVEVKKVEIVIPAWMKVDIREMNMAGYKLEKSEQADPRKNLRILTYTLKNLKARKTETGMPGPSYVYPHLLVLTQQADLETGTVRYFASLADQYNWYRSLVTGLKITSPAIEEKSAAITQGATSPLDKMKKVLHWVQDNIRYIAFENGMAGFKPMDAEQVLTKRYGDCKGMANLTRSLLKAAGIDARLCWIGTNYIAYDYNTPSLSVDNHMICAVKLNGKTYFLDGTESYIGFDEYAQRIQGRQVLIENGDSYLLERVPVKDHLQNIRKEVTNVKINGTQFKGKSDLLWKGESKSSLLSYMHEATRNEQESTIISYLSDSKKGFSISGLVQPALSDWSGDLSARYDFEWKDAASSFGNEIYFEPDFRKEFADAQIDTTDRRTDYEFSYKYHIDQQTTFSIPAGYSLKSMPAPLSIERDAYTIKVSIVKKNNDLLYEKKIWFTQPRLAAAAIPQWNKDISALKQQYNEQIILTR